MTATVTRRNFVRMTGAGAAALALGPAWMSPARAAERITFGQFSPFTGAYAFSGPLVENGMRLALEERNYEILGHPIDFVTRDTETKPAVGVRRLMEAIDSESVKYFAGNFSSSVGLAQSEIATREKVLQYAAGGSEDFTGERCSRYTFQWSANAYTALKSVMDYAAEKMPDAKRWYTITVDYVFGHSLRKYCEVVAKEKGIELVGNDLHPLGERQFNQYLTKVIASQADVLCVLNFGSDAVTLLRQFHNFGLKDHVAVVGPWAMEVDQMGELSPDMREGLILGQNYFYTIDTPVNRTFVDAYKAKYERVPGYASAYGYDAFRAILTAMEKAGSVAPADIIKVMETETFDGILGPTRIDAATHQTIRPYYVVEGKAEADMASPNDYAAIVHSDATPQPKDLNTCPGLGEL
ncbi:MAG: hypothetical protein CMM50_14350 [Rhodospirillaceae bacterium]|nr:hypothetical protein [Rhodospirillaceae bacterium]